jgi:hypothetical protein
MAADDRRTLDAIFHHPAPRNLSWMDVLRLLTHLEQIPIDFTRSLRA